MHDSLRTFAKKEASNRYPKKCEVPLNGQDKALKVGQYFGENIFHIQQSKGIPGSVKEELLDVVATGKPLRKELAEVVASAVTEWALNKGVTHFCHWFQPLTGSTAEKHDAFLSFDSHERPIEKLSASQLMQGEPDASSFPHGGSRSTFEARGYTSWDITSPLFIMESENGRTLCIPTAFVSYHGDALDIKTPLLRSITRLSEVVSEFLNLTGSKNVKKVNVTCGAEQEYFLIDKAFYYLRPDLVMSNRTLFGSLMAKNQQLEDHYFGTIPERVLAFMQELEVELYKLGVPAKTRHNEVAPGQFELAPIFSEANVAADNNMLIMATLRKVANKHDFVCLLHEKPFAGINGSGKHVNWSMADDQGNNLLEPGQNPHENYRFLAVVSIIVEAIKRHADIIRTGIASHGNDHRLGANEAPPSIMSVFLGETLTKILESFAAGTSYTPGQKVLLDMGAGQLVKLLKDNTDRNRTSPFAFTGNKFEFRAVGSSQAIGFPVSILNGSVADIFKETNEFVKQELATGKNVDDVLMSVIRKWYKNSSNVVFNGDGYSQEWVKEAAGRGLNNFRTTAEALTVLKNEKNFNHLINLGVYRPEELATRYNVMLERYLKLREIEFKTLNEMINQNVLGYATQYKSFLADTISKMKTAGVTAELETELLTKVNKLSLELYKENEILAKKTAEIHHLEGEKASLMIANELMPLSTKMAKICNELEAVIPDEMWGLPTYYDMLFVK